jgi:threonine synthase
MAPSGERTASTLAFLEGSRSTIQYDADELRGTDPADGRAHLARYDVDAARRGLTKEVVAARRGGLWRWEELLPVRKR